MNKTLFLFLILIITAAAQQRPLNTISNDGTAFNYWAIGDEGHFAARINYSYKDSLVQGSFLYYDSSKTFKVLKPDSAALIGFDGNSKPVLFHLDLDSLQLIIDADIAGTLDSLGLRIGVVEVDAGKNTDSLVIHRGELNLLSDSMFIKLTRAEFTDFEKKMNDTAAYFFTQISANANEIGLRAYSTTTDSFRTRIGNAEINISTNANDIGELENEISLKADITQIDSLRDRMNNAEASIILNANDIDGLESSIVLKANTTSVDSLKGRMTTAEGTISTHTSQIGSLTSTTTSLSASITNLDDRLTTAEAGVIANADNIDGISSSLLLYAKKDSVMSYVEITPDLITINGDVTFASGYDPSEKEDSAGVVTIIDGRITAEYVEALGITANLFQTGFATVVTNAKTIPVAPDSLEELDVMDASELPASGTVYIETATGLQAVTYTSKVGNVLFGVKTTGTAIDAASGDLISYYSLYSSLSAGELKVLGGTIKGATIISSSSGFTTQISSGQISFSHPDGSSATLRYEPDLSGFTGLALTGNQYISGHLNVQGRIRSFSDEAYGSGWNGSTEVPTKNAVYDGLQPKNIGTASRILVSDGSGNIVASSTASSKLNDLSSFFTTSGFSIITGSDGFPYYFDGTDWVAF